MLVVLSETCPSHARMVLISTPARSRCVAVVWRIVWGLTRLSAKRGICSATVRRAEYRVHFRFFQIGDRSLSRLFERNRPELSAPCNMLRTPLPNEARQRMDRGQSLVAGRHATLTPLLQVVKKQPDVLGRDVIDLKLIDCFVDVVGDKREQQHEGT